jgi:histidyl-tRNA synthetase
MQKRCKGNRDLLPQDMESFRNVEEAFRSSCLQWGYEEIRTPTLEYLHLFTSTGTLTPSMLGRVYSFLDWDGWSGERVVLRPDGTIPTARLYIESLNQASPAKLFYVENIFSFEETGKESRERWQCGAEMLGSTSPSADVELIMLAQEVLRRLGIGGTTLCLSHAGLIRSMLRERIGDHEDRGGWEPQAEGFSVPPFRSQRHFSGLHTECEGHPDQRLPQA